MAIESVKRYSIWDGHETHAEIYDGNKLIGRSVERYSAWDGSHTKTEYYDENWNKVGESK